MNKVGERIRKLRKERGWTQSDLAKKVNVSSQVVSNWERKYTDPDHDDISRLSKILDVSTDFLLGRTTEKESKNEITYDIDMYEPIIREISSKYPDVDISDPEIVKKLMKLVDVVLDDYTKKK